MGLLGGIFSPSLVPARKFPPLGRPVSWAGLPPEPISPLSQNDERGEKEEAEGGDDVGGDEDENDGAVDGKERRDFSWQYTKIIEYSIMELYLLCLVSMCKFTLVPSPSEETFPYFFACPSSLSHWALYC